MVEFIQEQTKKLLEIIIDYVKDFVRLTSNAIVLFYQLDVISTEITDICLYNLLCSLTLKNPIYSKVIELFRSANTDMIQLIEVQIDKI